MALMSGTAFITPRPISGALSLLLAIGLSACASVTTAPPTAHLEGLWHIDPPAGEDADAKIAIAMSAAQAKLRKALSRYGSAPDDQGGPPPDTAPDAPDYTYDSPGDRYGGPGRLGPDFRGLRTRLHQALTPPKDLKLQVQGDLVTITADQLPSRDYRLDERISRFDEYGTAVITATWNHDDFVIGSHYTSHASRTDTYHVDALTGALTLTQLFFDPILGKISVRSIYRRG
jgi:hypothetical protein